MANTAIYPGSSSFTAISASWYASGTFPEPTPNAYYDADPAFKTDADRVAKFCAQKLGYPIMDVELQDIHFYQCFEEAVTVYGNEIFQAKIKDNYINLEGSNTGSLLNNTVVTPNLNNMIAMADGYGQAIQVGGSINVYSGSMNLLPYIGTYNMKTWVSESSAISSASIYSSSYAASASLAYFLVESASWTAATSSSIAEGFALSASAASASWTGWQNTSPILAVDEKIVLTRIFWQQTPGIVRFFDPYLGSGFNYQGMMETFGWGSLSPAVSYMMFPLFWDIERVQAIEMSDMVRRSNFSFEVKGDNLTIFPIPGAPAGHVWFEFQKRSELADPNNNIYSGSRDLVTNMGNVPYGTPVYKEINSPGRMWIQQYSAALAKEMLGLIRGKYTTIQIPGAETTLNQQDLLSQALAEKTALMERLRNDLDAVSRKAQLENKQAEALALKATLNEIPLAIYIG
jgi:hypothetical protein